MTTTLPALQCSGCRAVCYDPSKRELQSAWQPYDHMINNAKVHVTHCPNCRQKGVDEGQKSKAGEVV